MTSSFHRLVREALLVREANRVLAEQARLLREHSAALVARSAAARAAYAAQAERAGGPREPVPRGLAAQAARGSRHGARAVREG